MFATILGLVGVGGALTAVFNPNSIPGVNGLSAKITDVALPFKAQLDQLDVFNKQAAFDAVTQKDANGDPIVNLEDKRQLNKYREATNKTDIANSVEIYKNALFTVAGAGAGITLGALAAPLLPVVGVFAPTIFGLAGASIYGTQTASNLVALKLVNDAKQGTLDFGPFNELVRTTFGAGGPNNNLTPSEMLTTTGGKTVDLFANNKIWKQLGGSYAYAANNYIKSLKESGMPLLTIAGNIASSFAGPILSKIDPTASPNKVTA
jgi:hypothetical protein